MRHKDKSEITVTSVCEHLRGGTAALVRTGRREINYLLRCCSGTAFGSKMRFGATVAGRRVARRIRAAHVLFLPPAKICCACLFCLRRENKSRLVFTFGVSEKRFLRRLNGLYHMGFRVYLPVCRTRGTALGAPPGVTCLSDSCPYVCPAGKHQHSTSWRASLYGTTKK